MTENKTSSKRVLFITPQPFFSDRGSPLRVRSTISILAELGCEVDLLALPLGNDIKLDRVTIYRSAGVPFLIDLPIGPSWRKALFDLNLLLKAASLSFRNRYALIHGVEEGAFMASCLSRFTKAPFVMDMHSHMSHQLQTSNFLKSRVFLRVFEHFERKLMRRAAGVITVGDEITEKVRKVTPGTPVYSIEDIPLDSAEVVDLAIQKRIISDFGLKDKKVILYTGNFETYQGIDLLLEAFALRLKSKADHEKDHERLVLVGGGSEDSAALRKYRQKVSNLSIDKAVVFTGQRPSQEMGAFMQISDVLVSPRIHGENTPLKIYSYMVARRPIVATDIKSHTQVLSEKTAFLAAPEASAFGKALQNSLSEKDEWKLERDKKCHEAYELIQAKYSRTQFKKRLCSLYQHVLGELNPDTSKASDSAGHVSKC